jgi:hypothetical protein
MEFTTTGWIVISVLLVLLLGAGASGLWRLFCDWVFEDDDDEEPPSFI